jgi:group I intron endonuclease
MSEGKFVIYTIKCNSNDKLYIGITNNLQKRWNKHVYDAKHNSPCVIHCAMRKYGLDNFSITEIKRCSSIKELCELEQFYIKELKTHVSQGGYNVSFGGESAMMGRKHSTETRKRMSESRKGKPSPNKGKIASNETRKKLSKCHSKSVVRIDLDGNVVAIYKSITEAGKTVGIAGTNITKVCRNKKKTAGGFCWHYSESK